VIPQFNEPMNSPFVPKERKNVIDDRLAEQGKPPIYSKPAFVKKPFKKDFQKQNFTKGKGTSLEKPAYQPTPSFKGQNPLVNLQVYEPSKPKGKPKTVNPALYMPFGTNNPFNPPGYLMQSQGQWGPNQMPIIKNYNINVSGPTANHSQVNAIYEDILPSKEFLNSANTIAERLNIYNFVRSIFIKNGDGEDINLDGTGNNSLLEHLKFMELNPYNTNQMHDNPYRGLPENMLIYRSCYPIRFNRNDNNVQCAKNSIGMNIRIYRMSVGEYDIKKQDSLEYYDYDMWREVAYYEYVREQIIKQNVCPNFVVMNGYYINEDCKIDFEKLNQIKGDYKEKEPDFITKQYQELDLTRGGPKINVANMGTTKNVKMPLPNASVQAPYVRPNPIIQEAHYAPPDNSNVLFMNGGDGVNVEVVNVSNNPPFMNQKLYTPVHMNLNTMDAQYQANVQNDQGDELVKNPKAFSGRALVSLTEAPTQSLYSWASKTYQKEGNIKRMISTGYHKPEIWFSVLFQLMAALYTMQIHKICFADFQIADNVYIKDISGHGNITKYWRYKIDGIDYYIPNYGHLLLIDSNFKEVPKSGFTIGQGAADKSYKIVSSTIFKDKNGCDDNAVDNGCIQAFKNCFTVNAFSNTFTNSGGIKPPDDVMQMIKQVEGAVSGTNDIGELIAGSSGRFMNNRVGTYLKETEIVNIRKDNHTAVKEGRLVVHEVQNGTFMFVLFKKLKDGDAQQAVIYTKDEHSMQDSRVSAVVEKCVRVETLFNYSNYESIVQEYKANQAMLSDGELLETYVISKK